MTQCRHWFPVATAAGLTKRSPTAALMSSNCAACVQPAFPPTVMSVLSASCATRHKEHSHSAATAALNPNHLGAGTLLLLAVRFCMPTRSHEGDQLHIGQKASTGQIRSRKVHREVYNSSLTWHRCKYESSCLCKGLANPIARGCSALPCH